MLDYLVSNLLIEMLFSGFSPSEEQKEIARYSTLSAREQREFRENQKKKRIESDTKSNENLIQNCFEDPIFCYEYKPLVEKIKENAKDQKFGSDFQNRYRVAFRNIKFGCFCRDEPDEKIFKNCPVENSYLDLACKQRHQCLFDKKQSWISSDNSCDANFISTIEKVGKNQKIDYETFDRDSIEKYNSLKLISLIKIRREMIKILQPL